MPADDSLKRLGGGRWQTRDGRFAIEPQSGTWVVVDTTQTDDLGLPLVRGPFGSLAAAKEAIEGIRTSGPVESPLTERLRQSRAAAQKGDRESSPTASPSAQAGRDAKAAAPPEPPPEPKWLLGLAPADRRRARELIEKLQRLEVPGAEEVARSEIERNEPAIVRLAIGRALRHATSKTRTPAGAVRAAVDVLISGKDTDLGARWRLVDSEGRPVGPIELPE